MSARNLLRNLSPVVGDLGWQRLNQRRGPFLDLLPKDILYSQRVQHPGMICHEVRPNFLAEDNYQIAAKPGHTSCGCYLER